MAKRLQSLSATYIIDKSDSNSNSLNVDQVNFTRKIVFIARLAWHISYVFIFNTGN